MPTTTKMTTMIFIMMMMMMMVMLMIMVQMSSLATKTYRRNYVCQLYFCRMCLLGRVAILFRGLTEIIYSFTSGNSTYCWISDKTAIAVAMVTPVSFALLFNTVCVIKNARSFRHLQQVCYITALNFLRFHVDVCFKTDVS